MSRTVVSVVLVAVAIVFFAIGRYSGVHRPPFMWPRGPTVIGASIDLKCGDTTYTVSTGNDQGDCKTGEPPTTAGCSDGKGNGAEVSCLSGCTNSSGSGSCTVKKL
jgi:hypothetical protein